MREHIINSVNNFICGWYLEDNSICDEIIEYHSNSNKKHPGTIHKGVDESIKKSIDVILDDALLRDYLSNHLQPCVDAYVNKYKYCNYYAPFAVVEKVLIQHYKKDMAFYAWHCERGYPSFPGNTRHLVFMTYLNDVETDGETEFYYQDIKIKPEKGLTLIWPAEWTFTHRGLVSEHDKYVVTGWMNYIE